MYWLTEICTWYGTQQEGEVLHVYLDRESQHRLMSCMRMDLYKDGGCMRIASGPG